MAATQDADERAPLLSRSADSEFAASIQDKEEVEFNIWRDLAGLTRQAIPIFLSFAVQNAVQTISVLTVGRLGSFELEVSSYGFMFFSATGTMLAIGGATALDTLCGQAFTSQTVADDPQILGLLLQQCLVAQLGLFVLLIVPIWIFSAHLFTALGQEQAFASATARFLLLMLPAGVFQVVGESLKKFLQVQGASNVVGVVTAATSVVAVIINFVFVHYTGLKLWGVPCAFGVYQLLTAVGLLSVILSMPAIRKTCRMSMKGTMHGFPTLLFYAVTGILTIATEWWRYVDFAPRPCITENLTCDSPSSFEILAMMAARLNQDSIGAQSVSMGATYYTSQDVEADPLQNHRS
jgi:MATE family multidrug resistance protein